LRETDLRGSDDRRLRGEDGVRDDGRLIEGQVVGYADKGVARTPPSRRRS
jgi:hypothetical protein